MKVIGVIPARYEATRFPGKLLADLKGKPVIQHVWERAKSSRSLDELVVACDDERILNALKEFGAKGVYTSPDQPTGTDRLLEVVNPMEVDIIVNIQADEPFIHPSMIDHLTAEMLSGPDLEMATIIKEIESEEELLNPNIVKVVIDRKNFALYFSRSPIPYLREETHRFSSLFSFHKKEDPEGVREDVILRDKIIGTETGSSRQHIFYKHIGLYAYTKDFLFTYSNLPKSNLETAERLEQLRALEHGYRIKTIQTKYDTVGIDTPADLDEARKYFDHFMKQQ